MPQSTPLKRLVALSGLTLAVELLLTTGAESGMGQLPFAGLNPFYQCWMTTIWTCGKGVYSQPVAEHVLGSILALKRGFATYAREQEWSGPIGETLFGAHVVILGAGGIAMICFLVISLRL